MTVTSFGLLGLGRCSFTVLLPFKRYPPCFCPPWPPPPWPPPPVPVIPCWWCWWPGTKFSFRSRFSTFLLTKAEIGRKIVFDVAVQNVFLAPVVKKGWDLNGRERLLLHILRDRLYVKWVCCWCNLLVPGVGLTNARCSTKVTRVRSDCSNVCDSWQMWFSICRPNTLWAYFAEHLAMQLEFISCSQCDCLSLDLRFEIDPEILNSI